MFHEFLKHNECVTKMGKNFYNNISVAEPSDSESDRKLPPEIASCV